MRNYVEGIWDVLLTAISPRCSPTGSPSDIQIKPGNLSGLVTTVVDGKLNERKAQPTFSLSNSNLVC